MKHRTSGRVLAAVAALASLALASGCAAGTPSGGDGAEGDATATLTIAALFQPANWDPAAVGDLLSSGLDFGLVYDTLVRMSPEGEITPGLATEWSYDDTNTVLTLELREGQMFTDGTPEDAAAVVANLEHYQESTGPYAINFASISEIEAVDDTTVTVTFTEPNPSFVDNLSMTFIAAPSVLTGAAATAPVGAGPYVYDEATSIPGDTLAFTANPDFYEDANFAAVTHRVIGDPTAAFNALQSGQVDAALLLAPPIAQQAQDAGFVRASFAPSTAGLAIFDRAGVTTPALGDVRVRQAINYALDSEAIVSAYMGGTETGTLTRQIFSSASDAFDPALDDMFPYDVDRASELMAEAGYADGFEIHMLGNSPWGDGITQQIAKDLGAIGISVVLDQVDPAQVPVLSLSGQYPVALTSFGLGPAWDTMIQQVGPDAAFNPLGYQDERAEELKTAYQFATSEDDRAEAGRALNDHIVEQAWFATFAAGKPSFLANGDTVTLPTDSKSAPYIPAWTPAS